MRSLASLVLFSFTLSAQTVQGFDSCRDAFGDAMLKQSSEISVSSESPLRSDAETSLRAVNAYLKGTGLIAPPSIHLELVPNRERVASFVIHTQTLSMRSSFAQLAPLSVHGAFLHEFGHAIFDTTAMRDLPAYRETIRIMTISDQLQVNYNSLAARHELLLQNRDFDSAMSVRKELHAAADELERFRKENSQTIQKWGFGVALQEVFADLLPVFYLRDPQTLVKFGGALRDHSVLVGPDNWMEFERHAVLLPFVRHVVAVGYRPDLSLHPKVLATVYSVLVRKLDHILSEPNFAVGDPKKLNRPDKLKRESYFYGVLVSELNRELIADFDKSLVTALNE